MGLELKNIVKIYDNGFQAVTDFNLSIKDREFIVLVGPSGCGKSTTLRMIAGLESITKGTFSIDGKVVNDLAPKDRGIAMVFQSYALYPHLTVYENMAFGLELAGFDQDEVEKRVNEAAKLLGLTSYLHRKPRDLSGGQRQRVALGRSIIRHAKVFLMDEPLSNLDAKLRVTMRSELIKIHRNVGATTIYVTHDQIEAMTMADRIVVMNLGRIQQVGTPHELYFNPQNLFVAGFIGDPPMNFINGHLEGKEFVSDDGYLKIDISDQGKDYLAQLADRRLVLAYRPEHVLYEKKPKTYEFNGVCEVTEMLGDIQNIYVNCGTSKAVLKGVPSQTFNIDENITYYVDRGQIRIFDADTENLIPNEEIYTKA